MRDELGCGCRANALARIDTLGSTPQAMEEQLKEDQHELETHEQQSMVEDAKRICRIVHENNRNRDLSRVQREMGKLMHHDEREPSSVWEGLHWDDNKGGWLDPALCAKARQEEVEAPIKTG